MGLNMGLNMGWLAIGWRGEGGNLEAQAPIACQCSHMAAG